MAVKSLRGQRFDDDRVVEIEPCCVLDFYVHEAAQRGGIGGELFHHFHSPRRRRCPRVWRTTARVPSCWRFWPSGSTSGGASPKQQLRGISGLLARGSETRERGESGDERDGRARWTRGGGARKGGGGARGGGGGAKIRRGRFGRDEEPFAEVRVDDGPVHVPARFRGTARAADAAWNRTRARVTRHGRFHRAFFCRVRQAATRRAARAPIRRRIRRRGGRARRTRVRRSTVESNVDTWCGHAARGRARRRASARLENDGEEATSVDREGRRSIARAASVDVFVRPAPPAAPRFADFDPTRRAPRDLSLTSPKEPFDDSDRRLRSRRRAPPSRSCCSFRRARGGSRRGSTRPNFGNASTNVSANTHTVSTPERWTRPNRDASTPSSCVASEPRARRRRIPDVRVAIPTRGANTVRRRTPRLDIIARARAERPFPEAPVYHYRRSDAPWLPEGAVTRRYDGGVGMWRAPRERWGNPGTTRTGARTGARNPPGTGETISPGIGNARGETIGREGAEGYRRAENEWFTYGEGQDAYWRGRARFDAVRGSRVRTPKRRGRRWSRPRASRGEREEVRERRRSVRTRSDGAVERRVGRDVRGRDASRVPRRGFYL